MAFEEKRVTQQQKFYLQINNNKSFLFFIQRQLENHTLTTNVVLIDAYYEPELLTADTLRCLFACC